jgi:outer membrane receptor protein involved in Fe transport
MLGIERSTRTKQLTHQRDWRIEDLANPNTAGGGFAFGSATWFHNEPGTGTNNPSQAAVDQIFAPATSACPFPHPLDTGAADGNPATPPNTASTVDDNAATLCRISNSLNATRFRINRDGSVFTGLADATALAPGAYRFNGPVYNDNFGGRQGTGDLDGDFQGLPGFVMQPHGGIKENVLYNWASSPLERLSAFANGHFDVADNVRVTGQAMVTRTKTESSLGLTAANINQWGAGIPFGTDMYLGNSDTYFDIPSSLLPSGATHPDYLPGGRFGLNCEAPNSPSAPYADGLPGCTNSEAFPVPAEIYNLLRTRTQPNNTVWVSREPDWMRSALGAGRSTTNETTTMSFTLGLEGDLPSGDHSWDVSLYTGRSDNTVNQLGSMRLTSYRDVLTSPNFGRNFTYDSNPWEFGNFAEAVSTCTSGLPVADNREVSQDCLQMVSPALKNLREMTQTIFEANLMGDLAEMRAGPLQYALGATYRENGFLFTPDNLSDIQNIADPIAGLFPNEASEGEFDVSELYGELLVPIIEDGPIGVEHFRLELGARVSDWSMEHMPNLETYKALMDWAVSPRYRIRGGYNRAFRAPNLGELFSRRTQLFGAGGATRDWCSENLANPGTFSATPPTGVGTAPTAQTIQTEAICRAMMGPDGQFMYYDDGPVTDQTTAGGLGVPITFGNPLLREEQADTVTIGVAMDILEDWRLTVDWYQIEIENMIATEGLDATYQRCLDIEFNPTGDPNSAACNLITRNPITGGGATVDRSFTNEGFVSFSGVDLQLVWSHQMANGGSLNLNVSSNIPLEEKTQDRADLAAIDHAGYNSCGLGMQCQNYDYRLFSSIGYGRGSWNVNIRHQYWPELDNNACRTTPPTVNSQITCDRSSLPAYGLFSAAGNYRFADRYNLSAGIENLLDEEPPCVGGSPIATPFPTDCTRTGDGSTYDPLGRRFYISMTMDF